MVLIKKLAEDNGNNDPEKTKKRGKEVFPCGVCGRNVGVSSNKCIGCKKWIHFRCHAIYGGVGWGDEENYKCPKCVRGLSGLIKKKVAIRTGRKNGNLCSNVLKTNVNVKRNNEDRRNAKRELETEKEDSGEIPKTKTKRYKTTGKTYTEEEMEDCKKKLSEEYKRVIEEMYMNFRDEKEKIIRDRDVEIEKEDLLSDPVFKRQNMYRL